jgi:hypothetical protein
MREETDELVFMESSLPHEGIDACDESEGREGYDWNGGEGGDSADGRGGSTSCGVECESEGSVSKEPSRKRSMACIDGRETS